MKTKPLRLGSQFIKLTMQVKGLACVGRNFPASDNWHYCLVFMQLQSYPSTSVKTILLTLWWFDTTISNNLMPRMVTCMYLQQFSGRVRRAFVLATSRRSDSKLRYSFSRTCRQLNKNAGAKTKERTLLTSTRGIPWVQAVLAQRFCTMQAH